VTQLDRMAPSDDGATVVLTAQECTILAVSAQGLGVDAVAECLDLAPATVRGLLVTAVAKLGARSKLEAVVIALRRGLIDLP
jgi:two-component system nitrate/nitrite response regulator NarL